MKERKVYEPGVYSISNEEYHSSAGISRSGILEFKRSPAHYFNRYLNPNYIPKPSTKEMKFGTAFHSYVLEPEKFDLEYVLKPPTRENLPEELKLKDVGRELYDASKLARENERQKRKQEDLDFYHFSMGKEIITQEDFDSIKSMKESIFSNDESKNLVINAQYEKSIYWIDEDTKLLCKVRPDILFGNFVVDLKSTSDASFKAFQRDFYNRGYHIQMGMIQLAIQATQGYLINTFIDLAVETEHPHYYCIYDIDEAAINQGAEEFKYYLSKLKHCLDNNDFPGYQSKTLCLPAYASFGDE